MLSFIAHVRNQSRFLSLILTFFVTSFKINSTCRHHKGRNISQSIQNAVHGVNTLTVPGWSRLIHAAPNAPRLMLDLFGTDLRSTRYQEVVDILARLISFRTTSYFVFLSFCPLLLMLELHFFLIVEKK